jgi:DNA-binding XRE family transcriptional regulator
MVNIRSIYIFVYPQNGYIMMNTVSTQHKPSFLITIGLKLKSLRLAQNIEVESAAKSLKISCTRLRAIENGERDMRLDLFVAFCDLYEANVYDVLP